MGRKLRKGEGLFTHVHHGGQGWLEWSIDIEERFKHINAFKLSDEIEIRGALIKKVVSEGLPTKWKKLVEKVYDLESQTGHFDSERVISRLCCDEFHALVCHPDCAYTTFTSTIFAKGTKVDILMPEGWRKSFTPKLKFEVRQGGEEE